ncbi:MAG: hypothetical protein NTW28_34120 [Candidatus Solibacter sp.]|nr:hypothetical protein [Candidatus Solibacter sp.]
MATVTVTELAATLEQLQAQMSEISRRIQLLEKRDAGANGAAVVLAQPAAAAPVRTEPAPSSITEEELLAISAAIGAYLGVARAHGHNRDAYLSRRPTGCRVRKRHETEHHN